MPNLAKNCQKKLISSTSLWWSDLLHLQVVQKTCRFGGHLFRLRHIFNDRQIFIVNVHLMNRWVVVFTLDPHNGHPELSIQPPFARTSPIYKLFFNTSYKRIPNSTYFFFSYMFLCTLEWHQTQGKMIAFHGLADMIVMMRHHAWGKMICHAWVHVVILMGIFCCMFGLCTEIFWLFTCSNDLSIFLGQYPKVSFRRFYVITELTLFYHFTNHRVAIWVEPI